MPEFKYSDPGGVEEPATLVTFSDRIRFGDWAITNSAHAGDVANSDLLIDDPDAELDLQGLRAFDVRELSAPSNNQVIGRLVIQDRKYSRNPERSAIVGAARVIAVEMSDYNWHLGKRLLVDEDADRPAETIAGRLRWLINRAAHININDYGNVFYATRDLEPNDYRLQTPLDVLNDLVIEDNYNFWIDFNEAHGRPELFFIRPNSDDYSSTVAISNVLEDIDNVTVFGPSPDAILNRSASRIAFGAAVTYPKGFAYRRKDSTGAQFGKLDQVAPHENVKSLERAERLAQKYVNDHDEETDTITCSIKVPRAQVNDIRHGHNVNVKFQHFPGYEDYVRMRVLERTVEQEPEAGDTHYKITLQLTGPVGGDSGGGGGGGGGSQATAGAVIYGPDDDTDAGTTHVIVFRSTGDAPEAGKPTRPIDAAAFGYTGSAPELTGFVVLAASGSLNLHLKMSFINISVVASQTYIGRIKKNGVTIGSQTIVKTGVGAHSDTGTFDFLASTTVVAGDLFTIDMTSSELANVTVPFGAGDNTMLFEILASSTVVL